VIVHSVEPVYPRPKKKVSGSRKRAPESSAKGDSLFAENRHPDCQCQLVPTCMFCGEAGGSKVFTEGAFIVKGGKNGQLVDRYRGVAHTSCVEKHRKDWYSKNKERALYVPHD